MQRRFVRGCLGFCSERDSNSRWMGIYVIDFSTCQAVTLEPKVQFGGTLTLARIRCRNSASPITGLKLAKRQLVARGLDIRFGGLIFLQSRGGEADSMQVQQPPRASRSRRSLAMSRHLSTGYDLSASVIPPNAGQSRLARFGKQNGLIRSSQFAPVATVLRRHGAYISTKDVVHLKRIFSPKWFRRDFVHIKTHRNFNHSRGWYESQYSVCIRRK